MLDAAGWKPGSDGIREKGGQSCSFNLYRALGVPGRTSRRAARQGDVEADRGRLQGPGRQRGQAHRAHDAEGQGQDGPGLRHVHLGLGRRPVRPEHPARPRHDRAIGGSSDSFYSNPEYDKLYDQQAGEFDLGARKEIVKQLVGLTQRDLPYLVLTVDPILQAYRTDRVSGVTADLPAARRRHHLRRGRLHRVVDARPARRRHGRQDGGRQRLELRADHRRSSSWWWCSA